MLTHSIRLNQVDHYFYRVSGLATSLGRSKVSNGIALLKELDATPEETVLLGDSSHDLETAEALGVTVFVTRGYEDAKKLGRSSVADFIVDFAPILAELGTA